MRLVTNSGGERSVDILKGFKNTALDVLTDQVSIFGARSALEAGSHVLRRLLLGAATDALLAGDDADRIRRNRLQNRAVAIALAVVRRRANLFRRGLVTLLAGFAIAMVATSLATFVGVGLGWVNQGDLARPRVATSFIYLPDHWSIVVSIIAGAAGVLALTSARTGGLSGVFISVTTVPAAANLAMAVALGQWSEVSGSAVQLAVNLIGMIIAGIVTLLIQEQVWNRVRRQRSALRASR